MPSPALICGTETGLVGWFCFVFLRWREESHFLLSLMSPSLMHRKMPGALLVSVDSWVAGSGASSAGSHLGSFSLSFFFSFLLFKRKKSIRKTFALTLNPPPQVTVIAGPRGGEKKPIVPIWGQAAFTTLDGAKPGCSRAALDQVDGERAQSLRP